MQRRSILILLFAVLAMALTMGCSLAQTLGRKPPTPTPTFTKTPKPTFTSTPVIVDTPTPIPSNTFTPTTTPSSTSTSTTTPTETLEPTATLTDTPQPTDTPPPKPQGIINLDNLNFRAGPDTAYASLGKLAKGTQMEVRMRLADSSWLRVCCLNDQEGWVASQYMDLSVPIESIPVDESVPLTPTPRPQPPTNTPRPAAPTQPPPPTATPKPAYYYRSVVQWCKANCGITYIEGTVYEGTKPTNGKLVRFSYAPDGPKIADDYVTGTDAGKPGMYTIILEPTKAREGTWYVWVVDGSGNRISEFGQVTTTLSCDSGTTCQQAAIDFVH